MRKWKMQSIVDVVKYIAKFTEFVHWGLQDTLLLQLRPMDLEDLELLWEWESRLTFLKFCSSRPIMSNTLEVKSARMSFQHLFYLLIDNFKLTKIKHEKILQIVTPNMLMVSCYWEGFHRRATSIHPLSRTLCLYQYFS